MASVNSNIKTLVEKVNAQGMDKLAIEQNLLSHIIYDVSYDKDGNLTFNELIDYVTINKYDKLSIGLQYGYEIFGLFRTPKNAVNTLLHHIEKGKYLTDESLINQAKFTPTNVDASRIKNVRSYKQFLDLMEEFDYDKAELERIADSWAIAQGYTGYAGTMFADYYINPIEGGYTKGDTVKLFDSLMAREIHAKVLQASPNGFLTIFTDGMELLLTTGTANTMRKVDSISTLEMSEEEQAKLESDFTTFVEELQVQRDKDVEAGLKRFERSEREMAKAIKKKATEQARVEKSTKSKEIANDLVKLRPQTLEQIAEVRNLINQHSDTLLKQHKTTLRAFLKRATTKAKAKAEAEKLEAKAKAEAKKQAEAKAEVEVVEAIAETKTSKRSKRK